MKQVTIINKVIPAESRSKYGTSGRSSVISGGASVDLSPYLLKAIWERNFEERKDEAGNEYIYIKKPIVGAAGMTLFAGDEIKVDSIFKGLPIDTETLQWVDGVLTVVGGGTGGGASNWDELEGKPSWITDTKPEYTFGELTGKPTTLAGYGIPASNVLSTLLTVDGSDSGLEADKLDGYHANGLLTSLSSSRATNLSVTVGGTTKTISSLHADYAYSFANTRYLWGQPFDGTSNVSGNMTGVGSINGVIYIGSSGNVGIGESSPTRKLDVDGELDTEFRITVNGSNSVGSYPNIKLHIPNVGYGQIFFNGSGEFCFMDASSQNTSYKTIRCGNLLATGGGTFYSSDIRAKTIIERPKLSLNSIANSPVIKFKWNGYNGLKDDNKLHVGGIAQYIEKILPECVIGQKDDFLSFDYATTGYIFSVLTARHLLSYETRTDRIIRKLKERIKRLEKQLNIENHEEVCIVAD